MDDYVHWSAQTRAWILALRNQTDEALRQVEDAGSGTGAIPRQRRGLIVIDGGLLGAQHESGQGEREEHWEDLVLIELW